MSAWPLLDAMRRHPAGNAIPRPTPGPLADPSVKAGPPRPDVPDPTDRTRVGVLGTNPAAVPAALTTAWRLAARPITVVLTGRPAMDAAIRGWVAEHAFADITLADPDEATS